MMPVKRHDGCHGTRGAETREPAGRCSADNEHYVKLDLHVRPDLVLPRGVRQAREDHHPVLRHPVVPSQVCWPSLKFLAGLAGRSHDGWPAPPLG